MHMGILMQWLSKVITASESPYSSYVRIKNTAGYHASANVHNLPKQTNVLYKFDIWYIFNQLAKIILTMWNMTYYSL